jgi:RNA-binding protein 39
VGKIRDIKIIKDHKSGKSKGVAYVEFFDLTSVEKALGLNEKPFILDGKEVPGSAIMI